MRNSVVACVALASLIGTSAFAADMAVKAPMAPAAPVYTWTGCYLGVNGGLKWFNTHSVLNAQSPVPGELLSPDIDGSGGVLGGTVGCNYQFDSHWVAGVEGDFDAAFNVNGNHNLAPPLNTSYVNSFKETWVATIRGRLGFLVTNQWLWYVTGGGAFARAQESEYSAIFPGAFQATNATSSTLSGWTVGGGTEFMIIPRWTAKAEFLYVDLGTHTFLNPGFLLANAAPVDTRVRDYILRFGVNYKFF
jgi:outer membrane immunogenic protein